MKRERLRLENITLMSREIKTLKNFNLNLYVGEVLGVFIKSALEKQHFVELLQSKVELECGRICYENAPEDQTIGFHNKISLIQATSKLIDDLSIAENIFVIRERFQGYVIHRRLLMHQTKMIFDELGIDMDIQTSVSRLSAYEKTVVELARSYAMGRKVIILKDLSSFLADDDLHKLHEIIGRIQELGISFIMIESFIEILKKYADRLCVVKNGRNLWTLKREEIEDGLLETYFFKPKHELKGIGNSNEVSIELVQVETESLRPISFKIHSGEFINLLDSQGDGIESLAGYLTGQGKLSGGEILIGGRPFDPKRALKEGVAFIPEMPTEKLLFKHIRAIDNLCFSSDEKTSHFWLWNRFRQSCLLDYQSFFEPGELLKYTDELSIYTKQKLTYLKWHLYRPKLVVCMRPFSSIDVELREITAQYMQLLLDSGISILALTSNLSEINPSGTKIVITPK